MKIFFPCRVAVARGLVVAAGLTGAYISYAQTLPAVADLEKSGYVVYTGDFNVDSKPDVLLVPRGKFFVIDLDDLIVPIVIKAPATSQTILLQSGAGSAYTLTLNPGAAAVNSSVWARGGYDITLDDRMGTGKGAITLTAKQGGLPVGFTVASSASGALPELAWAAPVCPDPAMR